MAILPELTTERLILRRFDLADAQFVFSLLNDADFIRNIGDKGVRSLEDARRYLRDGPIAMYESLGFGLWHAARKSDGVAIGMCGLLKRAMLEHADLGYAYLPEFRGQGFGIEAARAVLAHGAQRFGLQRIVAVVSSHNDASIALLEKLGMRFERMQAWGPDEPPVRLYGP